LDNYLDDLQRFSKVKRVAGVGKSWILPGVLQSFKTLKMLLNLDATWNCHVLAAFHVLES
jgi:hypothetical protein